jgi:hypothetical protein
VYIPTGRKTYVDREIDEEITVHEDREAWTIDTVAVVVVVVVVVVVTAAVAATDADDDYDNDNDGEKQIIQFKKYYFSSTCRFATGFHLLIVRCLKNKVPNSNEINMAHSKCSMHTLFKLLRVYDYVTKLYRHQAKVIESN